MTRPSASHQSEAAESIRTTPVRCAVLTISDTRTESTDRGGPLVEQLLAEAGHETVARAIVPDEPEAIRHQIEHYLDDPGVHVVVTTGGTGVSRRDTTIEVAHDLISVELRGFGELFRMLSWDDIAAAAMLSRAIGGLVARDEAAGGDTFLFAVPGSPDAVRTAVGRLIAPQLGHLVWERRRTSATVSRGRAVTGVLGHGVDLVEVRRIERMLDEHGDRFRARCFTPAEQRYAEAATTRRGERYAARFACKEAALKALGTGWRDGIAWTDVGVVTEPSGRPRLEIGGQVARIAAEAGITSWHVSLSHSGGFAIASVLACGGA